MAKRALCISLMSMLAHCGRSGSSTKLNPSRGDLTVFREKQG